MKKTHPLFCLLAAAVAQASDIVPVLTTSFGTVDEVPRTPITEVSPDYLDDITIDAMTVTNSVGSLKTSGTIAEQAMYYIPATNVGGGNTWTTTLTYSTEDSLTLRYVAIEGIMCTGAGAAHQDDGKARGVTYTITVKNSTGDTVATGAGTWTSVGNGGNSGAFTIDPIVLTPVDESLDAVVLTGDFSVEIAATRAATNGAFFGLKSVTLAIPEPTTATLSLLALAGLAARRRRH